MKPKRPIRLLVVIGTRPEAIKMAPVIKELRRQPRVFHPIVCATAQHREMLDQALGIFGITPDIDLDVMRPKQSLTSLTARILVEMDKAIEESDPDWVLVQGDTTTAMAASLAAFYHRLNIGHVEAGLRTDDRWEPFPEEINRRVVDQMATLYFAPTAENRDRLIAEGVAPSAVIVTGNTVIDALLSVANSSERNRKRERTHSKNGTRTVLVTAHRRESFGRPLRNICSAIAELAATYNDTVDFVYPVHLNPNVRSVVFEMLGGLSNVSLIDPVDYETLVELLSNSWIVLTDSGGIQEEAPSLDVPVLVLRDVTEREEAIRAGGARLVGTDSRNIVKEFVRILEDPHEYARMASAVNPYGDGKASQRIAEAILCSSIHAGDN